MPNRLAHSGSPYLRQHQDNPVDWFAWSDEAFALARANDRPIFLSIGYSSCHWCHVMAHESFEDVEIAKRLNASFISIKVDREELPDVDETYMTAVQLSGGRGGWPMTLFLTPDRQPFFAATYLPREDSANHLGFRSLVERLADAWQNHREQVERTAGQFDAALRQALETPAPPAFGNLTVALVERSLEQILEQFDPQDGGFGNAPKFPPHAALRLLIACSRRPEIDAKLRAAGLNAARLTLEKMVAGGIHDQVGGGFHRYATDAIWRLPHFEKMLYDNALMIQNLSAFLAVEDAPLLRRARARAVAWLLSEMRLPVGFASAMDADSDGGEGRFYVWTKAELGDVLDGAATSFSEAFDVHRDGNFREEASGELTGENVLVALDDPRAHEESLDRLRSVRARRPRPALDTKAIVGWNGLAVAALAAAEEFDAAIEVAQQMHAFGVDLPHLMTDGVGTGQGYLEDFGFAIEGFLAVANATGDEKWLERARRLKNEMVHRFYDHGIGGFFSTSRAHEELFGRSKPVFDQPIPSGNSAAVGALLALDDTELAIETSQVLLGWMERAPLATEALLAAVLPLAMGEGLLSVDARITVAIDSEGRGRVRLTVPEGWHVTPSSGGEGRTAARVWLEGRNDAVVTMIDRADGFDAAIMGCARGDVIGVQYQVCSGTECRAPQVRRIPLANL